MADTKRRSRGEDSIYFDHTGDCRDESSHRGCPGRWRGAVSSHDAAGKRRRSKVSGKTKTEVKDKLRELHTDLDVGVKTSASYTVSHAVADWTREARDGRSASTLKRDAIILKPVLAIIGGKPLRDLTTHDVRNALAVLAEDHSSSTVTLARGRLVLAIRHAEAGDHVRRNVAALVTPPAGTGGRPSRSLTTDQASAVLAAAEKTRLYAYIVLCLLTGIRTEEARALRWDHVDLDNGTIAVWRSVRQSGDTKTAKSRRTLALPQKCVDVLTEHRRQQAEDRLKAGPLWQDNDLVFASTVGTPLNPNNVIRDFRKITVAAGIGEDWTPREMRHTFVSVMSEGGVLIEEIPAWSAIPVRGLQRSSTVTSFGPRLPAGPKSWTRYSPDDRGSKPALGHPYRACERDLEYIEGFHNRRRRHSALHRRTPIEFETTAINRVPTPQIAVR